MADRRNPQGPVSDENNMRTFMFEGVDMNTRSSEERVDIFLHNCMFILLDGKHALFLTAVAADTIDVLATS